MRKKTPAPVPKPIFWELFVQVPGRTTGQQKIFNPTPYLLWWGWADFAVGGCRRLGRLHLLGEGDKTGSVEAAAGEGRSPHVGATADDPLILGTSDTRGQKADGVTGGGEQPGSLRSLHGVLVGLP